MSPKEQMRERINELFTTGKLKGVKDLATLLQSLESRESFEKKANVQRMKTSNSQLVNNVWIPHLKIVREFFRRRCGEESVTKFKLSEPCEYTEEEKNRCKDTYYAGIQDLIRKLTIPHEKVEGKRTCHSKHESPYHLVKWTYIKAANREKYRCDIILFKIDLYVTLYTSNGAYYELKEQDLNEGRKFQNIGSSLQSSYDIVPQFICGDLLGRSIIFFDGDDMEKVKHESFAKAQKYIQVFYWFCSEAMRYKTILDEICHSFDDWFANMQISEANRTRIHNWKKMSCALRGDPKAMKILLDFNVIDGYGDLENCLEV